MTRDSWTETSHSLSGRRSDATDQNDRQNRHPEERRSLHCC